MSYLVMECHPGYAVLLDEEGRFLKAANLRYEIGQTVYDPVLMKDTPEKQRHTIRWISSGIAAIAACFLLLFGFSYYQNYMRPYSSIYLTINPEVRMDLNRQGTVVELTGAGSSSASDVKAESQAKVETASNAAASDDLMKKTIQIDTKETDKNGKDGNRDDSQAKQTISENSQIRKAVDEINKKAHNSEAVFGIHDATNRVTIKIVDKDTKKVLKEYPPEKTLDMIAKVWEMAGLLVDQKL